MTFTLEGGPALQRAPVEPGEVERSFLDLQRSGFTVRARRVSRAKRSLPESGQLRNVLVVEDDRVLSQLITAYLSGCGFTARVVVSSAEVVEALSSRPMPDLVLLDVGLPDANGFDILQRMRAHPELSTVPVIMLTGHAARADVLEGLSSGADAYITKPFVPEVLMMAVEAVMTLGPRPPRPKRSA